MVRNYKVIEVTKENKAEYLHSIAQLEEIVLSRMEKEGRVGQLFITGEQGIEEYIDSKSNHVMIAVKDSGDIHTISAAYITQGQIDFTYNDITKYFKFDDAYKSYIKSKYPQKDFEKIIRKIYIEKICAFKYARDVILQEQGVQGIDGISEAERSEIFLRLVEQEVSNPNNQFHEKSEIRDNLNKYMSLYMKRVKNHLELYQDFYWVDLSYIEQNSSVAKRPKFARKTNMDKTMEVYDRVLQYQKYKIHDRTHCAQMDKYFGANTENTIELDTYITYPDSREKGIARILVLEGIKKSLGRLLQNEENKEVFLVSTLHQDNLSSKYVSEFFGLTDYLFLNRRSGRDRQVHIFGMTRDEVPAYIKKMEKKVAVLYDYNPQNIHITIDERIQIIEEQLAYETCELQRLQELTKLGEGEKFQGYVKGKISKIKNLSGILETLREKKMLEDDDKLRSLIGA